VGRFTDRIECNIQGDYELVTRSDPSCGLLVYDTVYSGTWMIKLRLKNLDINIDFHFCSEDGVTIFLRKLSACLLDWTVP